jgi:hypothetical protein
VVFAVVVTVVDVIIDVDDFDVNNKGGVQF